MRRYGAFEIAAASAPLHEEQVPAEELEDVAVDASAASTRARRSRTSPNVVPAADARPRRRRPPPGRRRRRRRGAAAASRRRAAGSSSIRATLADWGWPEYALPRYIRSHVHPDALEPGQMVLISTFRLPVQIHTRSANAKWLDEIAHTNPLWMHPRDAAPLGVATGDLVRVETEIGHFVVKAWVTEGIRPGVVACSHHMGRWKPGETRPAPDDGDRRPRARRRRAGACGASAASRPFESRRPRHRGASGGPTSASTRTSRSPCTPTRSRACTAGTRPCACGRPGPATRYGDIVGRHRAAHAVYARWLSELARRGRTRRTARGGHTGCCGRSSPRATRTGCRPTTSRGRADGAAARARCVVRATGRRARADRRGTRAARPSARPTTRACSCSSSALRLGSPRRGRDARRRGARPRRGLLARARARATRPSPITSRRCSGSTPRLPRKSIRPPAPPAPCCCTSTCSRGWTRGWPSSQRSRPGLRRLGRAARLRAASGSGRDACGRRAAARGTARGSAARAASARWRAGVPRRPARARPQRACADPCRPRARRARSSGWAVAWPSAATPCAICSARTRRGRWAGSRGRRRAPRAAPRRWPDRPPPRIGANAPPPRRRRSPPRMSQRSKRRRRTPDETASTALGKEDLGTLVRREPVVTTLQLFGCVVVEYGSCTRNPWSDPNGCDHRDLRARGDRALARAARRRRLLGRLVRTVPHARPRAREPRPASAPAGSSWSRSTSTPSRSSRRATGSRASPPSPSSATASP